MDFIYGLADNRQRTQIFYASGQYNIPKGVNMVQIIAIGAGGGGGAGQTRTSGSQGFGGGAGGSGELSSVVIARTFLGDALFINVGIGGASNVDGGMTFVDGVGYRLSSNSATTLSTRIVQAQGGIRGNNSAGGSRFGGTLNTDMIMATLGIYNVVRCMNGQSGSPSGSTNNIVYGVSTQSSTPTFSILRGGGGGGGISSANIPGTGGGITGTGFVPNLPGGTANGGNGVNGIFSLNPFISLGGTGGGSNNSGIGGKGGDGGPGCGGGGGGAGSGGGAGGRGGNGLVIITCW
jgi:hypothetical protein